jgi:hypothetical protein
MTYDRYLSDWPLTGTEGDVDQRLHQGPNSRACDMQLSPFNGPLSVMRGAEALAEAGLLETVHNSCSTDGSLDAYNGDKTFEFTETLLDVLQSCKPSEDPHDSSDDLRDSGEFDREESPASSASPTAADLRQGLGLLRELSEELRNKNRCDQLESDTLAELAELRQELKISKEENYDLKSLITQAESIARQSKNTIADLRTELDCERIRNIAQEDQSSEPRPAGSEHQDTSATRIYAELRQELHAESEACAEANLGKRRLAAELSVANGHEVAAKSVAASLHAEVIVAERRIQQMESNACDSSQVLRMDRERSAWDQEKAELLASLDSARQFEAQEAAVATRLRSARDTLKAELSSEKEATNQAKQSSSRQAVANDTEALSIGLQAIQRENELRSMVAESEHRFELERVKLESDKQRLQIQVDFLNQELQMQRHNAAQSQQQSIDAEATATRLIEENRRLHSELISEFSVATAAAKEASIAASSAASSAAAIQEMRRSPTRQRTSVEQADSPLSSIHPLSRRLLQDPDMYNLTPAAHQPHNEAPEAQSTLAALMQSRCMLGSGSTHLEGPEYVSTPKRLLHAGDVAAGGAAKSTPSMQSWCETSKMPLVEREQERDVDVCSPLSKPFLGGPLGLARALAKRSALGSSRSPTRKANGKLA